MNEKAADKDEVTGKIIKGGDDILIDWIWRLCNLAFESGVVIVPVQIVKERGLTVGIMEVLA